MLKTLIAAALLSLAAPTAMAAPLVIGHRGANTTTIPENTLKAMQYATPHAQMLEADIQWTKDSSDADTVGTIIIFHDTTLDRTTNCTGYVSTRLWTYIRDTCRTTITNQPILKLVDLITYAKIVDKPILFDMKINMTSAQAKQFWKHAKHATAGSMVIGNEEISFDITKIKMLDNEDSAHQLRYGLVTSTSQGGGAYLYDLNRCACKNLVVKHTAISASAITYLQSQSIRVYLWTGKNETDYASMVGKSPDGVIVDDAKKYQEWLVSR